MSRTQPAITLSWDWVLGAQHGKARCQREGAPYSNIMLVSAQRQDLGYERTAELLGESVDARPWQDQALLGLNQIYSGDTCQI